jgi:intracellular septation protein A
VKHSVLSVFAAILATLTLLALDDITTGQEINYKLEYGIIAISVVYFLFFIPYCLKHLKKHHSKETSDN